MNEARAKQEQSYRAIPLSHKVLFTSVIVIALFLFVEFALRLIIPANLCTNPNALFMMDPVLGWTIEPNQNICFIWGDGSLNYKRSNQYGTLGPHFDSPRPPNTYRVLVVGDSHLHSPISEHKTFSTTLQRMLQTEIDNKKVEVVNAAVGGYSPYQQLLRIYSLYNTVQPDLILWGFYAGNDIANLDAGEGPFIDDHFRGWVSPVPYERKMRLFQASKDEYDSGAIGFLQTASRMFDLFLYAWDAYQKNREWDPQENGYYQRMKNGPLRNLSVDEIENLIPDRKAYQSWTSWYAQAGNQRKYFANHPERSEVAYAKVWAMIAAMSLLQERTGSRVFFVYIPSFLESPDTQLEPYPQYESALGIEDMRNFERVLAVRCQEWSQAAGINYQDGLEILREKSKETIWYDHTAHLTETSQTVLAEYLKDEILRKRPAEKQAFIATDWIVTLPEPVQNFALNPWPSHPGWKIPREPVSEDQLARLVTICALPSPGPYQIGATWQFQHRPETVVYQTLWKENEQGRMQRFARFNLPLGKNTLRTTFWCSQGMLTEQPIPSLPDKISLEDENRNALSAMYDIPWL